MWVRLRVGGVDRGYGHGVWVGVRVGKRWWKGESATEERMGGGRRGWKGLGESG